MLTPIKKRKDSSAGDYRKIILECRPEQAKVVFGSNPTLSTKATVNSCGFLILNQKIPARTIVL